MSSDKHASPASVTSSTSFSSAGDVHEPMLSSCTPSTLSRRSPYPDLPRCSLRLAFIACTVLQVSVACVLVWYLGYESAQTTVGTLSSQLRNQTMSHMIDQVSSELSSPILAVNEVDLLTQQQLLRALDDGDPTAVLDWSTDTAFYTTLINIVRHYPGVTATAMQTSTSVLMTAFLAFNDTNVDGSPPWLAYLNQDSASGWGWQYWNISAFYDQRLSRTQLYTDINILATTANWFEELPAGVLAFGRQFPLLDIGYVAPEVNNWSALEALPSSPPRPHEERRCSALLHRCTASADADCRAPFSRLCARVQVFDVLASGEQCVGVQRQRGHHRGLVDPSGHRQPPHGVRDGEPVHLQAAHQHSAQLHVAHAGRRRSQRHWRPALGLPPPAGAGAAGARRPGSAPHAHCGLGVGRDV